MSNTGKTFSALLKFFCAVFAIALLMRIIPLLIGQIQKKGMLEIAGQKMEIIYANTKARREKGLSGVKQMNNNSGMLFVFPEEGNFSFWMKDTLIPLDLVFIDNNFNVVDIKQNEKPCEINSCPQIVSEQKFRYVLEVNAGWTNAHDLKISDRITVLK